MTKFICIVLVALALGNFRSVVATGKTSANSPAGKKAAVSPVYIELVSADKTVAETETTESAGVAGAAALKGAKAVDDTVSTTAATMKAAASPVYVDLVPAGKTVAATETTESAVATGALASKGAKAVDDTVSTTVATEKAAASPVYVDLVPADETVVTTGASRHLFESSLMKRSGLRGSQSF